MTFGGHIAYLCANDTARVQISNMPDRIHFYYHYY